MSAEIIPFPRTGRAVRSIVIVPDHSGNGHSCRALLAGQPLDSEEDLSFRGPLWWVEMMARDNRRGLPIRVHPNCERGAGA